MTPLTKQLRVAAHHETDAAKSDLIFKAAQEIETLTARLDECRKTRDDLIARGSAPQMDGPESWKYGERD